MTTSLSEVMQAAAYHFQQNRPLFPMYFHLIVSALFPIYAGAHASLSRPSSAAKPNKRSQDDTDEDDDEESVQNMEGLSPKDAIVFPITAGVVLAGLYFAIKRYGADLINTVLGLYFGLIGTWSVGQLINDSWTTLESFVMPTHYVDQGKVWKVHSSERKAIALNAADNKPAIRTSPLAGPLGRLPLPEPLLSFVWSLRGLTREKFTVKGYAKDLFDFSVILTRHNAISSILSLVAISYSVFVEKPWWLTNLQGFAVSYGALQLMSPTTFGTATLILSGLFFYDIWAVFFTPLMVTVAKNLDVPIKLVFPRPEEPSSTPGEPPVRSYSMLGLGDIVLPGLMIALALRFDLFMFYVYQKKALELQGFPSETTDTKDNTEKPSYVTATGHWGDKLWTSGAVSKTNAQALPTSLTTIFPRPYFTATMVGYVIGMIATLVFMSVFQHAQPALLYLVPAVLTSFWGTALIRGELKHVWNYTEALTLEPIENDGTETNSAPEGVDEAQPLSLLSKLWGEIFGTEKKSVPNNSTPASTNDIRSTDPVKTDAAEKTTKSDIESGKIFSLTISRRRPQVSKTSMHTDVKANSPDKSPELSSENSGNRHNGSDSISDDAVLVSSADLDGAKDVDPRYRGRAEKKARLE